MKYRTSSFIVNVKSIAQAVIENKKNFQSPLDLQMTFIKYICEPERGYLQAKAALC
ncbi:hypothetical protein HMP0721_0664 [Pseudoramibacter alactolyticus ATCC 23263]|uniref:Uncharacterized protein n=1 Tax=Pseudoramibacter alactolyticus ATCC 23263 TaxID=887929 RepID=E6MF81_9FIRM|nr:hypothetical protein HMP0721_0664 [Pseudoramibacter alactolyticus ATCC 23263]